MQRKYMYICVMQSKTQTQNISSKEGEDWIYLKFDVKIRVPNTDVFNG